MSSSDAQLLVADCQLALAECPDDQYGGRDQHAERTPVGQRQARNVELPRQQRGDADSDRVPPPRSAKPLAVPNHLHRPVDPATRTIPLRSLKLVAVWI